VPDGSLFLFLLLYPELLIVERHAVHKRLCGNRKTGSGRMVSNSETVQKR
jgi:hypothetical protein